MPVDQKALLKDLQRQVKKLEADLKQRAADSAAPEMGERLKQEYQAAREAERTAETYSAWQGAALTQAAVAWVLGGVFIRFLEDNRLIEQPLIAGAGVRAELAADRRDNYFRQFPNETDRQYFQDCFKTAAKLPGMAALYDERHNPVWTIPISGDAAKELMQFWRAIVPATGALVHDFTDEQWDTRFLGDLYQHLSESVRKRYALLQTPDFIEEFILERTLLPAIEEFGLAETRMIDPTCGSGHFLLGGFHLLLDRWQKKEPGTGERELVQRALNGVYGVDINPYATAIARFRLLIAALRESHIDALRHAPAYEIHVATGDSLLHGPRMSTAADALTSHASTRGELDLDGESEQLSRVAGIAHAFESEDIDDLNRILGQQYHAVVGNPPYLVVRDKALNSLYRQRYRTCHRQYALTVPFLERFFELSVAVTEKGVGRSGLIMANSLFKREFGKKCIERFLPNLNLDLLIDAGGTYIPGHGTPTVILFGSDQPPLVDSVRVVSGIKGEPGVPDSPCDGIVWKEIVGNLSHAGYESSWISVSDHSRVSLSKHPVLMSGGLSSVIQATVEAAGKQRIANIVEGSIGRAVRIAEEDIYMFSPAREKKSHSESIRFRPFVIGEEVRDWVNIPTLSVWYPYSSTPLETEISFFWRWRMRLANRSTFQGVMEDAGLRWFDYMQHTPSAYATPLSITFAFVATHNHFVLDRGGKVFKQSAPVIKLPAEATEQDHLALLGVLNSSTACFWMKQVFHNKGGGGIGGGIAEEAWEQFYELTGTGLKKFPLPKHRPTSIARQLDQLATERQSHLPAKLSSQLPLTRDALDEHRAVAEKLMGRMMALQEELDWRCYELYGLTDVALCMPIVLDDEPIDPEQVPCLQLGERAFEIVMARRMAAGELDTSWFARHGSSPITQLPEHWTEEYRRLVESRIAMMESDRNIGLLEQPEFKRRWNLGSWEDQEKRALTLWLLDRLENPNYWPSPTLRSVRSLAEVAERDDDFRAVAELLEGRPDIDWFPLVQRLVKDESVPFLPALRYKPSGLVKRAEWQETWATQRREDALDAEVASTVLQDTGEDDEAFAARLKNEQRAARLKRIGKPVAPPKYKQADFINATYWNLRGGLDVPKERFISYPHCSAAPHDGDLIAWAGWNHVQQAIALTAHLDTLRQEFSWDAEQLKPLLGGLLELLPWLHQWHAEPDADYGGERMNQFIASALAGDLQQLGITEADVRNWQAPQSTRGRRARADS